MEPDGGSCDWGSLAREFPFRFVFFSPETGSRGGVPFSFPSVEGRRPFSSSGLRDPSAPEHRLEGALVMPGIMIEGGPGPPLSLDDLCLRRDAPPDGGPHAGGSPRQFGPGSEPAGAVCPAALSSHGRAPGAALFRAGIGGMRHDSPLRSPEVDRLLRTSRRGPRERDRAQPGRPRGLSGSG